MCIHIIVRLANPDAPTLITTHGVARTFLGLFGPCSGFKIKICRLSQKCLNNVLKLHVDWDFCFLKAGPNVVQDFAGHAWGHSNFKICV